MEKSWRDIFRITDEEDATHDQLHSQNIQAYLNIHNARIESYSRSGLNRLNDNFFYTIPIHIDEITKYFKRTKHKAPGLSRLNKKVMEKCSNETITMFLDLFNACFSAGLFPTAFKKAIIRFIPKEGKTPRDPMNYRPISMFNSRKTL